jgi:hypothetical protein
MAARIEEPRSKIADGEKITINLGHIVSTAMWLTTLSSSNASSTAPVTPGHVAASSVLTPIRGERMPRGECSASFSITHSFLDRTGRSYIG